MQSNTRMLTLCGLFAALSAILSQVAIPIGPVPISFTHVSIFMAAGLLGKRYATISQTVFVLLGAFGVPVFSGFQGGFSVVAGPRGGFIIGYLFCTFLVALLIERFGSSLKSTFLAMYVGWVATYAAGIPWFMYVMGWDLKSTVLMCVVPFLPGDLVKTIVCAVLINRLRPVIGQKHRIIQSR